MLNDDLYSYLSNALNNNKIYPDILSQSVILPAIAYRTVNDSVIHCFEVDTNSWKVNYYFEVFGISRKEANILAESLIKALQNYKGMMGDTKIDAVLFLNADDDFDEDTKRYIKLCDFEIWYEK